MSNLNTCSLTEVALNAGGIDANFSPNGQFIIVTSNSGTAQLLDLYGDLVAELKADKDLKNVSEFGHLILGANFHQNRQLIVTGLTDGTARLCNFKGEELAVMRGHQGDVINANFTPDRRAIFTFSLDGTLRVWDLIGNNLLTIRQPTWRFAREENKLNGYYIREMMPHCCLSGDRKWAVFYGDEESQEPVELWDLLGNKIAVLQVEGEEILPPLAFAPDSNFLLTSCTDGSGRVWRLDGSLKKTIPEVNMGNNLSFSPDGKAIAFSRLRDLCLWDFDSGKQLQVREKVHDFGAIATVDFSPDGRYILTAGLNDGTVRLWDLFLEPVAVLHRGETLIEDLGDRVENSGEIVSAKFSPDGRYILAVSQKTVDASGYLLLWRVAEFLSEEKSDRDNSAESIPEKVGLGIM